MPSLGESFGGLTLPVPLGQVKDERTLASLDPVRRIMVDLFSAAIEAELGDAWRLAAAKVLDGEGVNSQTPVADTLELEPIKQVMQQRTAKFPLLAIYRSGTAEYQTDTIYSDKLVQPWTVDWVLGPVDVARAHQLGDAAVAVAKIIDQTISKQGHPAYEAGAVQFGEGRGDLSWIRVLRHEGPGQARFASGDDAAVYWAITITLETTERVRSTIPGGSEGVFEGADYDVGIGGAPEGVIHGLLYANTDPVLQRQGV